MPTAVTRLVPSPSAENRSLALRLASSNSQLSDLFVPDQYASQYCLIISRKRFHTHSFDEFDMCRASRLDYRFERGIFMDVPDSVQSIDRVILFACVSVTATIRRSRSWTYGVFGHIEAIYQTRNGDPNVVSTNVVPNTDSATFCKY